MSFTDHELACLESLEGKLNHVRDGVAGVVKSYHTGLFLHGEGGTSKSYTVTKELERLEANWILHNSRLTGRGLFDAMTAAPSATHMIEDAESLFSDPNGQGVARSALWSQDTQKPQRRLITWGAYNTSSSFVFTGGLIVISNANLAESIPQIRAIKTRIKLLQLDISGEEVKALMKKIALDGYTYGPDELTPDECMEVRAFIINSLDELNRSLDLRLMINAFRDMLQWKAKDSTLHWHQLLTARIQERATYKPRAVLKAEQSLLAQKIHALNIPRADKLSQWAQATGLSERAFYRLCAR